MNDFINWEKQYKTLEIQLKDMMKMSLQLMKDSDVAIEDIVFEEFNNQKFVIVITSGNPVLCMFKFYDIYENLLETIDYTYRNSINISNYKNLEIIKVYIKDYESKDSLHEKKVFLDKNNLRL